MNEEWTSIEDLETEEIGRLYQEAKSLDPCSKEYGDILASIKTIRYGFNEANRYWSAKEQLDFEAEKLAFEKEKYQQEMEYRAAEQAREDKKVEAERQQKEKELKQTKWLEIAKNAVSVFGTVVTASMAFTTLKYGIKFGPISSKEAWNLIWKKKL